jgi:AcrR family transcriptional regulator
MTRKKLGLPIVGQEQPAAERADAARNRVAILEAARKLLKKRPIDKICMDELAEAAGVGKGTLYRRFADRSSLCRALLHDEATRLQQLALRGFDLPANARWVDRLERLLDALFDHVAENGSLLSEAAAYERGAIARFDHPGYAWQREAVALYLRKAVAHREIAAVPPDTTADFLLAALDPDLVRWHVASGRALAELRRDFQGFWRRAITA